MLDTNTPQDTLLKVFRKGTRLAYKKGEFIIRPGEAPSGVFYIQEGLVKAFDITKYGEENLLTFRKLGEIFPLIWAFTGQGRNVIYQTLAPTIVWRLDRTEFLKNVKKDPAVLQQALDVILEMYRIHSERIMNLEYRTVRERLISFLLIMSQRFGKETNEGMLIDVPIKQQDIASSINSSRETTGRELSRLEQKGLVKSKQSFIVLLDIEKLRSYL